MARIVVEAVEDDGWFWQVRQGRTVLAMGGWSCRTRAGALRAWRAFLARAQHGADPWQQPQTSTRRKR